MKPYFETQLGKLYCGDALELVKELPNKSVKLVFADYPFKVPGGREKYIGFLKATAEEFKRVLTKDGWLVVINNPTNLFHLAPYLQDLEFRNEVVLVRPHVFYPPGMFGFKHNAMWILSKKKQKLNIGKVADVMDYQNGYRAEGAWHPEAIPEWLARLVIEATTEEDDIVLDPFAGSGTVLVVAEKLGRRWIGIEIKEEYCKLAKDRVLMVLREKKNSLERWLR